MPKFNRMIDFCSYGQRGEIIGFASRPALPMSTPAERSLFKLLPCIIHAINVIIQLKKNRIVNAEYTLSFVAEVEVPCACVSVRDGEMEKMCCTLMTRCTRAQ